MHRFLVEVEVELCMAIVANEPLCRGDCGPPTRKCSIRGVQVSRGGRRNVIRLEVSF